MAEQKVLANLNGIDEEIRKLNRSAKQAASSVKDISVNLQYDPKNVELITQRFSALRNELKINEENLAQFNSRLQDLQAQQQKFNNFVGPLSPEQRKEVEAIRRAIEKYETAIDNTTRKINYLKAASSEKVETDKKAVIAEEELRKQTDKLKKGFEVAQKAIKAVTLVTGALQVALTKAVKSSIDLGTELYNLSVRYNTNAEDIQIWNRALQLATGQTDLFTTAVNTMIKGLSQISAGRGVAYRKALQNIGLAYKDLETMSTEQRFRAIVEALGETADANVRLEAAQQLLGESGQSIADMFDKEGFSLDAYLEKASHFGTLTQQNAQALTEMGFEFEYAKSQMNVATAQLTIALAPALQVIANLITNVAKVLKNMADAFGGMNEGGGRFLIWFGSTIILLPKIISLIKTMAIAVKSLNLATLKWQLIFSAVALVIIGIIKLIAVFSSSAKKALDDVNGLMATSNDLVSAGSDFGSNVETVATTNTYRRIDVNTEIHGSGDTPISDEGATKVAQITADEIQRALGDLIK